MGFYVNGFLSILYKPLYRDNTVYIITHKKAINQPVDHTGGTQHTL